MADPVRVEKTSPQSVTATVTEQKWVYNDGPTQVYYDNLPTVSSSSNDGSVAAGGRVLVQSLTYFIAADVARLLVWDVDESVPPGITPGESDAHDVDTRLDWVEGGRRGLRDKSADQTGEIQAALNASVSGGPCVLDADPDGFTVSSPLVLTDGMRLLSEGAQDRWRSSVRLGKINYTGTEAAVKIQPGASTNRDGIEMEGIVFDGAGASGSVDGFLIDSSAVSSYIEGVNVERCNFTNFPRYQIHMLGEAFDLTFRRVTAHNKDRAADHCIFTATGATAPSQILFDDCWVSQYTTGKWCYSDGASGTVRFLNGDFNAAHTAANGIRKTNGGIYVYGTHLEGIPGVTGKAIEVAGVHGGEIFPSRVVVFAIGVHIGDTGTPAASATGFTVGGTIHCTTSDVKVSAGGERDRNVILPIGQEDGGAPTIDNQRAVSDGVFGEVVDLNAMGQTLGAAATDAATTQTLANNVRTALINLGLGKT